jgi:hypothetical protein
MKAGASRRIERRRVVEMDAILEILKAILAVGVIVLVALLVPVLFMLVFTIATSIDERMSR